MSCRFCWSTDAECAESINYSTAQGPKTIARGRIFTHRRRNRTLREATASMWGSATRPADGETQISDAETPLDPIDYWRKEQAWPKEYFELDIMNHLLPRKRSTPSLRRKRSDSGSLGTSSTTPSDQKPREEKSAPYRDVRYETLLATKGSFLDTSEQGILDASKAQCQTLVKKEQAVPQESLFRDDLFESTCRKE
jgi:hypothetical protein